MDAASGNVNITEEAQVEAQKHGTTITIPDSD